MRRLIAFPLLALVVTACHDVTQPVERDAPLLDSPSFAVTGTTFQVTTYQSDHWHPAMSGDLLVWEDHRHAVGSAWDNYEIYGCEWDAGTSTCNETRITNLTGQQRAPAVSGNLVVWEDGAYGARDVYACEWTGSGCSNLSPVATGPEDQGHVAVSGNLIVFEQGTAYSDIWACEWQASGGCSTPVAITSTPVTHERQPKVSGNVIVWSGGADEVFGCWWTGTGCSNTKMLGPGSDPDVSAGKIVWASWVGSPTTSHVDTCRWPCTSTERLITISSSLGRVLGRVNPDVSADVQEWIVWGEHYDPPDIVPMYVYDPDVAGAKTQIHPNEGHPVISGTHVLWAGRAPGDSIHIFMYQISEQAQVGSLTDEVEDLRDGGTLTANQADGLLAKLNAVLAKLAAGKTAAAINQLKAFIKQVQGFMSAGVLSAADGQHLIDWAQSIIDDLTS